MPENITMPRLSDSMEEGIIVDWLVQNGAKVRKGQEIAEIETDKSTMSYESEYDGFIKIEAKVNAAIPLGDKIASVYPTGEEALKTKSIPENIDGTERPSPEALKKTLPRSIIKASPIAKRVATENSIELGSITGTGPDGRIVKNDVISFLNNKRKNPEEKDDLVLEPLSNLQKIVSERMQEAKKVPHFYMSADVNMERILELRLRFKDIKNSNPEYLPSVPSINDFLIKIASETLKKHPLVNNSYSKNNIIINPDINIGIAVSREKDLLVPVIKNTGKKNLSQIAAESKSLISRVLDNKILPEEMSKGTFTVSNLGMFNVKEFSAIINKPQAAILAVGAIEQRAVVADNSIVSASMMTITLSSDHRIIYGATAASFIKDLKYNLENPELILI